MRPYLPYGLVHSFVPIFGLPTAWQRQRVLSCRAASGSPLALPHLASLLLPHASPRRTVAAMSLHPITVMCLYRYPAPSLRVPRCCDVLQPNPAAAAAAADDDEEDDDALHTALSASATELLLGPAAAASVSAAASAAAFAALPRRHNRDLHPADGGGDDEHGDVEHAAVAPVWAGETCSCSQGSLIEYCFHGPHRMLKRIEEPSSRRNLRWDNQQNKQGRLISGGSPGKLICTHQHGARTAKLESCWAYSGFSDDAIFRQQFCSYALRSRAGLHVVWTSLLDVRWRTCHDQ